MSLATIIKKELEKIRKELDELFISPTSRPTIGGAVVVVKCRYLRTEQWFSRSARSDEEYKLMDRYVSLKHALECPRLDMCPAAKIVDELLLKRRHHFCRWVQWKVNSKY
jgi:hypothetical protein